MSDESRFVRLFFMCCAQYIGRSLDGYSVIRSLVSLWDGIEYVLPNSYGRVDYIFEHMFGQRRSCKTPCNDEE